MTLLRYTTYDYENDVCLESNEFIDFSITTDFVEYPRSFAVSRYSVFGYYEDIVTIIIYEGMVEDTPSYIMAVDITPDNSDSSVYNAYYSIDSLGIENTSYFMKFFLEHNFDIVGELGNA